MSKIQLHKIEKGRFDRVLDVSAAIGAIFQVVIGVILILQLYAYQRSNDLLKKTFDDSHIPWLEIEVTGITPLDPTNFQGYAFAITYDVENKSDYPANAYACYWLVRDPATGTIHLTTNRAGAADDCIMPHSIRHFNWFSDDRSGTFFNGINNKQWICEGKFTYSDIYGHKLGVSISGAFDKHLFVITSERITGYFPQANK